MYYCSSYTHAYTTHHTHLNTAIPENFLSAREDNDAVTREFYLIYNFFRENKYRQKHMTGFAPLIRMDYAFLV